MQKLNLDHLAVETFSPDDAPSSASGTVEGQAGSYYFTCIRTFLECQDSVEICYTIPKQLEAYDGEDNPFERTVEGDDPEPFGV
jgi:hypothetical protein